MDLNHLKILSDLKYQHSQKALSTILSREKILRGELGRLRDLARQTQAQPPDQERMRLIGGDVIWLQWLGETQRKLNIELAQVLAQKEAVIAQHRRSHGRKIVSEKIAQREADNLRQDKREAQLNAAIQQSLF